MLNNTKKFALAFLNRTKPVFSAIGFILLFLVLSIGSYASYDYYKNTPTDSHEGSSSCNVLGINVHGSLITYIPIELEEADVVASDWVMSHIESAENDDSIKAILVEIESTGGLPIAGEEIEKALQLAKKPTVALIRQSGLSTAYLASTGADRIFASKYSDVGSIGVTQSYLENIDKDTKFIDLAAGKFKDAGNPDKPITQEEKNLFMRDVNITHRYFMEAVSANRKIPMEKVALFSDGSSFMGEKALEFGLIDQVGGIHDVKKYLRDKIGEEVEICWEWNY